MKFYVYEWFRIEDDFVFYVGKGTRRRWRAKAGRNYLFLDFIKENSCDVRKVEHFENEEESLKRENELISYYKSIGMCTCNMILGGCGGVSGEWTEDMRLYMSINNPMKDPEQRARMSINNPMKDEKQKERMSKNNPMKDPAVARRVGDSQKRAVVLNGVEYKGSPEACEALGICGRTVLLWCKRGYDTFGRPCSYANEEQKVYTFRKSSAKKVWVDDILFNSLKEASEFIGVWSESIIRSIRNNRPCKGYMCKYDNQQVSQANSDISSLETSTTNS